jgi:hypothetical protein
MTSGEQDSSAGAKRAASTTRVREFRKRQKLGLLVRTIRISPKQVTKLTALGYLDFRALREHRQNRSSGSAGCRNLNSR